MSVPAVIRNDCMGQRSACRLRTVRKGDCRGACSLRAKDDFVEPAAPARTLVDVTIPMSSVALGGVALAAGLFTVFAVRRARR